MTTLARPRFERQELLDVALERLADGFDPAANLIGPAPYFPPPSLGYAWVLLDQGRPEGIARAEAILRQILSSQELREAHIDHGHFRMRFGDPCIADLNAVQLILIELIPLTKLFGHRVNPALRADLHRSVRAGVRALEELNAHLTYTNVAVLDIANRILGGELIEDAAAVERGTRKLDDFLAYSNAGGGFRDYTSPTYLGQMLSTVATLANHASNPSTVRKAEVIQERLFLQAATHYHAGLAQIAGPYCRAYPLDVWGASGQMKSILYAYYDDERLLGHEFDIGDASEVTTFDAIGTRMFVAKGPGVHRMDGFSAFHLATRQFYLPEHVLKLFSATRLPASVEEGAEQENNLTISSHLGRDHTLGTARKGFGSQARNLIAHAPARSPGGAPKVFYSRFFAPGDPLDLNIFDPRLPEYGVFAGLQSESRAIGLYGARLDYRMIEWLGVELFLLGAEDSDTIWTADRSVGDGERLPAEAWFFLDLGAVYIGVYPLALTALGDPEVDPVLIHRERDQLRITIENYAGPAKHFWKYATIPWEHREDGIAPFFNGNLRAGFVIEVADAADWSDFTAFREAIGQTAVEDRVDGDTRRVTVTRDGRELVLGIDLITFEPRERFVNGEPEHYVFLDAQNAVQINDRPLSLGGFNVSASAAGPWVVKDGSTFVATNPTPHPVTIEVDDRPIELAPFGSTSVSINH